MSRNATFINDRANIPYPANFLEDPMDDDDEVYWTPVSMFTTRMNQDNQEPWGVPLNSQASTQYPPNFPSKIKELIELVPVPQGDIGDDLRPMLVEVASQNFSDVDLADVAAVLSFAPLNILEDIARLIVHIVKHCWQASPGSDLSLGEIALSEPQNLGTSVLIWLEQMRYREGRDLGTLTSRPLTFRDVIASRRLTFRDVNDIVFLYTDVIVQPTAHERLRFVIDHRSVEEDRRYGDLTDDDIIRLVSYGRLPDLSERIKAYIASLQTVPRTKLDPTDKCGVCLEVYYQSSSPSMKYQQEESFDTALQLPCRHIFCAECLTDWLKTTSSRSTEYAQDGHSSCPLCRARISIWD